MQDRDGADFSDPTGWRHLAEAHGNSIDRSQWPAGALWNECEHGGWFFLPWHRMYLYHFERIVRAAVVELGGPSDWALPYWNYSDPDRPDVRKLPPAFRAAETPDGEQNRLLVQERHPSKNAGGDIDQLAVDTSAAFAEMAFAGSVVTPSFGGAQSKRAHRGGLPGTLEVVPHGTVHMEVGGSSGWMGKFETAGRDPIFWLHHANLDRLWEAWLLLPGRENPVTAQWLDQQFKLGSGSWVTTLKVSEMLDTEAQPLDYRYDELPAELVAAAAGGGPAPPPLGGMMDRQTPPELIGASAGSVPLGHGESSTEIDVRQPVGPLAAADEEPRRIYLKLENVIGSRLAAGSYVVHLDLPGGTAALGHPETRAGVVSLFGVRESSRTDEDHSGTGLSFMLDVTDVATELMRASGGSLDQIRVTFSPLGGASPEETEPDVQVGGVKLFVA